MKAMLQGKEINSLNHCNFAQKFILMFEAMKMPEASRHGSTKARKEGKTVHFTSLMNCHLEISELETQFQHTFKYKRVVLRGEM